MSAEVHAAVKREVEGIAGLPPGVADIYVHNHVLAGTPDPVTQKDQLHFRALVVTALRVNGLWPPSARVRRPRSE